MDRRLRLDDGARYESNRRVASTLGQTHSLEDVDVYWALGRLRLNGTHRLLTGAAIIHIIHPPHYTIILLDLLTDGYYTQVHH